MSDSCKKPKIDLGRDDLLSVELHDATEQRCGGLRDVATSRGRLPNIQEKKRGPTQTQWWLKASVDDSLLDPIIGVDIDGLVRSWNRGAESKFGYAADEIIGTPFIRIIPVDRAQEWAVICRRIRYGEEIEHFKTKWRSKGGFIIPISLSVWSTSEEVRSLIAATNGLQRRGLPAREAQLPAHHQKTLAADVKRCRQGSSQALSRLLKRSNRLLAVAIKSIPGCRPNMRLAVSSLAIGRAPILTNGHQGLGIAPKILIVDDMAISREIAGYILRSAGYEVVLIEDGAGAVATVATANVDVVLMDVRMPKMDGLEATRRIRALGGPIGRVPIVALTVQAHAEQVAECQRAGMDDHIAKPFSPEQLVAAVVRMTYPDG